MGEAAEDRRMLRFCKGELPAYSSRNIEIGNDNNNECNNDNGCNSCCEECAICFDSLPSAPVAVLTKNGRRVCRHFFHQKCVTMLMAHHGSRGRCPCCRTAFDGCLEVPHVEADAKAWFK